MMAALDAIEVRRFTGRDVGTALPPDGLTTEARAALGQYTLERLMAYGLSHADATELRGRVAAGERWRDAALSIAATLEALVGPTSVASAATNLLLRAAAATRMAQAMMIEDTDERRAIFAAAAGLFDRAAAIAGDRRRETIATAHGTIVAWRFAPAGACRGAVLVIGGIEGWGMDFAELGGWLARAGLEAWCVDGPGQGESRLAYGHYLHERWREVYREVVAHLTALAPGRPIGIVGSSVGGTLALEIAADQPLIAACCANGGPQSGATILGQQEGKVPKKRMMCGADTAPDAVDRIWRDIDALAAGARVHCPVLLVHGQRDPLIDDAEMERIFVGLAATDKRLVMFSDGDHCVYNHADDKHAVICDWMVDRLSTAGEAGRC